MANHIEGPLYYERMGRTGPVMAFIHPNPMDQSCWIFPDGAPVDVVPVHRHRHSGVRAVAQGYGGADDG